MITGESGYAKAIDVNYSPLTSVGDSVGDSVGERVGLNVGS